MSHFPPAPLIYGGAGGVPGHLRPARKPQEGYLNIIAAALLYRQTTYFYKMICA